MADERVTVAIVPGERFSLAPQSLASTLAQLDDPNGLIYIDGGSPPLVRQHLEQRAARRGFRLISTERFVSANAARNAALAEVRTRYVAFLDSDVAVSPGWLEALVECAEDTGAWAVGSLCCRQAAGGMRIESAGGTAEIALQTETQRLRCEDHHVGAPAADVVPTLERTEVGQVAFRAMLVDMAAMQRLGPLDEDLLCGVEHLDFCMRVRQAGQRVFLEPKSVVTTDQMSFEPIDHAYYQLRWSDAWIRSTLDHFCQKWNLPAGDPVIGRIGAELAERRRLPLEPYRRVLRLFGALTARWVERVLIAPLEQAASRRRFPHVPAMEDRLRRAA